MGIAPYGEHLEIIHDSKQFAIIRADCTVDEKGQKHYKLTPAHYRRARIVDAAPELLALAEQAIKAVNNGWSEGTRQELLLDAISLIDKIEG